MCLPSAQAFADVVSSAVADAGKELSEEPTQLQAGETAYGVHVKTAEEARAQESRGAIVEMVEKEKKTDEEVAADAAAQASANGFGASAELPKSLDLRERGVVSSVKSQGDWGTCWSFSSNAAAEISLASAIAQKTGQTPTALDFSALQTAWFGYTPLPEDASTLSGTAATQAGEGTAPKSSETSKLNMGANVLLPASCFTQGIGVSWLADTPYCNSEGTRGDGDWSLPETKRFTSLARVKKVNYLDFLHTASWSLDESALTAAKTELNEGRGLVVAYRASYYPYMNYINWCQYNDTTDEAETDTNHLVCIVGYDDDYSADNFTEGHRPPGNGAFLVKNSWGSTSVAADDPEYGDWGIEGSGYFWLSYYDHSIYRPCSFEFDLDSYTGDYIDTSTEIVDQYDYMQVMAVPQTTLFPESDDGWYANVYTASERQSVHHVGTYYFGKNRTLKYRVYKLRNGATAPDDYVSDVPAAEGTYRADSEGYVNIALDAQVRVEKGAKYAVWFSQADEDGASYLPRGQNASPSAGLYSFGATAVVNEGESFSTSSLGKKWTQLSGDDASNSEYAYDNYCVKAYASVLPDAGASAWKRLAGNTAFGTMGRIVNEGWESSEWAVVATSKSYHDALAASGLAGLLDCPILLTAPQSLTSTTSNLLKAKGVKKVVVVGGTEAVSDAVVAQIKRLGATVDRVAGATAVGTASAIYEYGKARGGWSSDAIVATAGSYQDALSIAPYAYARRAPIFLAQGGSGTLTSGTASRLKAGGFTRTIIVGGVQAVASSVEKQVVKPTRLAGNTAYGTSRRVADFCLGEGMIAGHMGVACGRSYQDALTGAALCGRQGSVLILADDKNSSTVGNVVKPNKSALEEDGCYIFGGTQAVSASVEAAVKAASK